MAGRASKQEVGAEHSYVFGGGMYMKLTIVLVAIEQ